MTRAKYPLASMCAVLLFALLILLAGAPDLHAATDEAQSWYEALNLGGKAVNQMLAIQAIGMVGVLVCVGWVLNPVWRGAVGATICLGFQIFKDPRLLSSPSTAIADRMTRISSMGEQETMANIALAALVIFVCLLIFDLYLVFKPANETVPSFGVKTSAPKSSPEPEVRSAPPPPPSERKSIFD